MPDATTPFSTMVEFGPADATDPDAGRHLADLDRVLASLPTPRGPNATRERKAARVAKLLSWGEAILAGYCRRVAAEGYAVAAPCTCDRPEPHQEEERHDAAR